MNVGITSLIQLLLNLSRHTKGGCNVADMMKLPGHIVVGMYNQLQVLLEEENKEAKKNEKEEMSNYSSSIPNFSNFHMPSLPAMPKM